MVKTVFVECRANYDKQRAEHMYEELGLYDKYAPMLRERGRSGL